MSNTAILALRILGEADEAVKAFDDVERRGAEWERSMGKLKAGVGLAGAAAGAALLAGFNRAVENSQSNNKLAASLGLTGAESERLGKLNGELFADAYGDSLDQVNEASRAVIGNIAGMREASDSELSKITGSVLNLSDTFDLDLGATTTAVGQLMRTGMATDASNALDIITVGLQGNSRAADDLLDTFTEYPALFQALGLDGATATGLINQGLAAGARNTDVVADALKEFQIRATDGSATSAAGFQALGIDAAAATAQIAAGGEGAKAGLDQVLDGLRNMSDPVARNAAAVALFGTKAEDLAGALGALDVTTAVDSLGEVDGAITGLNDTVNQDKSIEVFTRTVQKSFTDVAQNAIPLVMPALDALSQFAPVLGPLALVLAGVAVAVGTVSAATAVYSAAQTVATAAVWLSNAAWLANPIVLIVIVIIAVLAGIIIIIVRISTHMDEFRDNTAAVMNAISGFISPVVSWFQNLWDWVTRVAGAIGGLFSGGGFSAVADAVAGGFESRVAMVAEPAETSQSSSMMRSFAASATPAVASSLESAASTARAGQSVTYDQRTYVTVTGAIDKDGTARTVTDALNSRKSRTGAGIGGRAIGSTL